MIAHDREWIREELRTAGLFHDSSPALPPPYDRLAERLVLSAVLGGHVAADVVELEPADFHCPTYAAAFSVALAMAEKGVGRAEAGLSVRMVAQTLALQGYRVEDIHEELVTVRDATEFVFNLKPHIERMRQLSRWRSIIEAMLRAEALMRADADERDIETSLQRMREVLGDG